MAANVEEMRGVQRSWRQRSWRLVFLCALAILGTPAACAARSPRPAAPQRAASNQPAVDTALQREIEGVYAEFLVKLRALANEKDITRERFIEALRTIGARVPAKLSDEDIARAKQVLPALAGMFTDVKELKFVKLLTKGDRAGYIFQPKQEEAGQFTVGIIKLARTATPAKWRVIKVFTSSLERRKELTVERQLAQTLEREEPFHSLYDEIELEPLQERADLPAARFHLTRGKRPLKVLLNGVELRLGDDGSMSLQLVAAEAQQASPLAADALFRHLFALRWGKNELKMIYGPSQNSEPIELSLQPRGYERPAFYATVRNEAAGELAREFTIAQKTPSPQFPEVAASLPEKSYGVFFVESVLANVSFRVNGKASGMTLVGADGVVLVDGLKPGRNKIEILHQLVEHIPPSLEKAPRQARIVAVLPGKQQVLTLPLSPKQRSKALTVIVK